MTGFLKNTVLAVACGFCLTAIASAQTLALVDTPAGQAFKARHYDLALAEFERLAAAQPRDALVVRYLAMTLDRLGRYDDAIAVFQQALALTPLSAAVHFHLGVTYHNAQRAELAHASFQKVLELAPGSLYAERAQEYLQAAPGQPVQAKPAAAARPFDLHLQGGLQYDSNIPAAPGDSLLYAGEHSGLRSFEYLTGAWHFLREPGWLGSLEASSYQAQYPDSAFSRFRLATYSPGAALERTTTVLNLPLLASLKYEFRTVLLDGAMYSRSHVMTAGAKIDFTLGTSTSVYYRQIRDKFADKGFDAALSSRDADNHALGLAQVWYFADRKAQLRAGYEFQDNDSAGTNFRMTGHKATLSGTFPLAWGVQANLSADYSHDGYPDFQGPVIRTTHRRGLSAGLSKWLNRNLLARLEYAYTHEDSSYELLSYRRRILGGSISYVY